MKTIYQAAAFVLLALALRTSGIAQVAEPKPSVLITNANVFDGQNEALAVGMTLAPARLPTYYS